MSKGRQVLTVILVVAFGYVLSSLVPAFLANVSFGRSLREITRSFPLHPQSAVALRSEVMTRAEQLGLKLRDDDVEIRVARNSAWVAVRYEDEIHLPGYTVKLHFSPSAGE
jgi:hypothetical protein